MKVPLTWLAIPSLAVIYSSSSCKHQPLDSKALDNQMLEAARNGDAASVQKLLRKGASIHAKNENGETALMIAASEGDGPLVAFLVGKGASADEKNEALFSVVENQPARVEISHEEPMQHPDSSRFVVGSDSVVNELLSKGADVEARDEEGATPLIRAASFGGTSAVKLLLERGADANAWDNMGFTALIGAACECAVIDMPDTIDAMQLLLDKGAEIDAKTATGDTALMRAAGAGRTQIVRLLLDRGAMIDDKNRNGETALMIAASGSAYSTIEATKLLLDRGSKIEARDNGGKTALILSASANGFDRFPTVKLLLARGANIRAKDKHGETALSMAKKNDQQDIQGDLDKLVKLLSNAMKASH